MGLSEQSFGAFNQQFGLDANKPVSPNISDKYVATDTKKNYTCYESGTWEEDAPALSSLVDKPNVRFDSPVYQYVDDDGSDIFIGFGTENSVDIRQSDGIVNIKTITAGLQTDVDTKLVFDAKGEDSTYCHAYLYINDVQIFDTGVLTTAYQTFTHTFVGGVSDGDTISIRASSDYNLADRMIYERNIRLIGTVTTHQSTFL